MRFIHDVVPILKSADLIKSKLDHRVDHCNHFFAYVCTQPNSTQNLTDIVLHALQLHRIWPDQLLAYCCSASYYDIPEATSRNCEMVILVLGSDVSAAMCWSFSLLVKF